MRYGKLKTVIHREILYLNIYLIFASGEEFTPRVNEIICRIF